MKEVFDMKHFIKYPVMAGQKSEWDKLKDDLRDDLDWQISPLYEQTSSGEELTGYMADVDEEMGVWLEPSIQFGMGGIWIYSREDDHTLAEGIDYQTFNDDVIEIALDCNSSNEFKNKYKQYLVEQIDAHSADDDNEEHEYAQADPDEVAKGLAELKSAFQNMIDRHGK